MRLLIDTHLFLWWTVASPRLGARAKALIMEPDNEVYVSSITGVEIAIKQSQGKLDWQKDVRQAIARDGFRFLLLDYHHAAALRTLPFLHRDPFDRLLVCQALTEGLALATHDEDVVQYSPTFILV